MCLQVTSRYPKQSHVSMGCEVIHLASLQRWESGNRLWAPNGQSLALAKHKTQTDLWGLALFQVSSGICHMSVYLS